MSCPPENELLDFLDRRAPPDDLARVERHLAGCARCSAVVSSAELSSSTLLDRDAQDECTEKGRPPAGWEGGEDQDALLGQLVGEYRVEELIGLGGMGVVYRGRHPIIGREVAIKVLRPELAAGPDYTQSMLREALAATEIDHRGIVNVFAFGELSDGRQYMVMEHLRGEPLSQFIRREAPLEPARLVWMLDQILEALGAAHASGVVHRDLKPSNLFLHQPRQGPGAVKLLDFGLARRSRSASNTGDGAVVGTPRYISPEQVRGVRADARADLYSLGVIAFELATGRRPFEPADVAGLLAAHLRVAPPRASTLRPELPPALDQLIARLLEKNPDQRFQTASEVRAELERLRRALWPSETRRVLKPVKRRALSLPALGGGLALLAGAAVAVAALSPRGPERPPAPSPGGAPAGAEWVEQVVAPGPGLAGGPELESGVGPEAAAPLAVEVRAAPADGARQPVAKSRPRPLSRQALLERATRLRERAAQRGLADPAFELLMRDAEDRARTAATEPALRAVDSQLGEIQSRFLAP